MMKMSQKLSRLKMFLGVEGTENDGKLIEYLNFTKDEIIGWLYSLIGEVPEDVFEVPSHYEQVQIQACVVGFNMQGAENETSHNENGINRAFKYTDALDYIHNNVIPYAKVV